jgi:hypothetical protein
MTIQKIALSLMLMLCVSCAGQADPIFERVFGIPRTFDSATVDAVKALPAGEVLRRDTDGDGTMDELWYIDTDKRHTQQPVLVRVVDEDGDLEKDGRGDRDSDCYFWDWHADGTIDVVTDYQDNDGDNDLDEMGIFYDKNWRDDKNHLTVWWADDIGDDNLLWHDVDGTYYQQLCQWRTHFSGDELFYQFRLSEDTEKWLNMWEDPFAFYDADKDGCSEEVVRISAVGEAIKNLRYSLDADDDAYGRRTHDYDFSVTAIPSEEGMSPTPALCAPRAIRGIATENVLTWENTRIFGQTAPWGKAMLCWDESNSNTDENVKQDPHERWEGVLNAKPKSESFPQVGGPPTAQVNTRMEIAQAPASPLQLYYDDADRRFHLLGASEGFLDVDYNFDGTIDAAYTYTDKNDDGIFDLRQFDADADGTIDCEWPMDGVNAVYTLDLEPMQKAYKKAIADDLNESRKFVDAAEGHLFLIGQRGLPASVEAVRDYFQNGLKDYVRETGAGERLRKTPAGARFYLNLMRDLMYVELQKKCAEKDYWEKVEKAYTQGKYSAAAALLTQIEVDRPFILDDQIFSFEYLQINVQNTSGLPQIAVPVTLSVAELRKKAPNFNPKNCAVVRGERWVDWIQLPHQVDTVAWNDEEELVFLAELPAKGAATFKIFYTEEGSRTDTFPQLTNAVLDTPAYVAWESAFGAYRFYTGQFDFFGKHLARLIPEEEHLLYPIIDVDYHAEQEWGMDALHVNYTSGLGGLSLYRGDERILVQSPAGEGQVLFEHTVITQGPVRAAVEITATNVLADKPDELVKFRCLIYAGHAESEIRVQLPKSLQGTLPAPALQKIGQEAIAYDPNLGLLASWGYHGDDIGEIGLGLILPGKTEVVELPGDHALRAKKLGETFTYWIIGDWQRGRQYTTAPTIENWKNELTPLAQNLRNPPKVLVK